MISVEITPPTALLTAMNVQMAKSPTLMAVAYKRNMTRLAQRAMTVLRVEPPPAAKPIRWTSDRQRRAYFATNGFGHGIPYTRTHALAQGWQYKVVAAGDGGEFVIFNPAPTATYVEGFDQQGFHSNTGWLYAPLLLAEYSVEAETVTAETWLTISNPFANVPQA